MKKIDTYLKTGFEFAKKYSKEYFRALLHPITLGLIAGAFVLCVQLNPLFAFLALFVSIPCMCCAFWKGYVTTFCLNNLALDFYNKNQTKSLAEYIELLNKKVLSSYLGFCAILTLFLYLPSFICAFTTIDFSALLTNPFEILTNYLLFTVIFLNTIFLLPFLNFFNQAFFFKKENENYFNLIKNCYKLQNKDGLLLSLIFCLLGCLIGLFHPFLYGFLALALNLLTFSTNTFWYGDKCQK